MKILLACLIIPWIFIFLIYNRMSQFKRTNLAISKELEARTQQLKKYAQSRKEIESLHSKIEEYKNIIADMQAEHSEYKRNAQKQIQSLEEELNKDKEFGI